MSAPSQHAAAELLDHSIIEQQQHQGIRDWVASELGGQVTSITRLERWRPQWKVEYQTASVSNTILVRGDRPIAGKHDLRFEMEVMEVLEANGIAVPHIYGWMDSPKAFVMAWVETEDRAPGMLHTAIDNPSTLSDERWQAMLSYMTHLANVHEVPVAQFSHIRRLAKLPETSRDIALHATERMYNTGVMLGNNDPVFEFLQHWLRRNVPEGRDELNFIAGDAGQFMSSGTDVLALLDFEIANLGDTHWDLACFRGRHPYENMGDIPALYREYERVSGRAVDLEVVAYYTVAFLQLSGIGATFFMTPEVRGGNWIEGMLEYASIARRAYEAIAELKGYGLDHDLVLPGSAASQGRAAASGEGAAASRESAAADHAATRANRIEETGFNKLMIDIQRLPTSTAFEAWERELLHAIPECLLNYSRYRFWFESSTVADVTALTGQSYTSLIEADQALMQWLPTAGASSDEAIVQAMHRRLLRLSMVIAGANPDAQNPLFHRLDPILS